MTSTTIYKTRTVQQYKVGKYTDGQLEDALNRHALNGWELYQIIGNEPQSAAHTVVFVRPEYRPA